MRWLNYGFQFVVLFGIFASFGEPPRHPWLVVMFLCLYNATIQIQSYVNLKPLFRGNYDG